MLGRCLGYVSNCLQGVLWLACLTGCAYAPSDGACHQARRSPPQQPDGATALALQMQAPCIRTPPGHAAALEAPKICRGGRCTAAAAVAACGWFMEHRKGLLSCMALPARVRSLLNHSHVHTRAPWRAAVDKVRQQTVRNTSSRDLDEVQILSNIVVYC